MKSRSLLEAMDLPSNIGVPALKRQGFEEASWEDICRKLNADQLWDLSEWKKSHPAAEQYLFFKDPRTQEIAVACFDRDGGGVLITFSELTKH
jgi:hypothetical protein